MMAALQVVVAVIAFVFKSRAHRLEWDDSEHSSFSFIVQHNASETMTISQITHDSVTYDLVDPIVVSSTGGLSVTIRAYMNFEDPVDDIKQAADVPIDYRISQYDFQSISSSKAASILDSVHDGTLEYYRSVSPKHLWIDGTLDEVKMKNYPITLECPSQCTNPETAANAFSATYGNGASGCQSFQEDCLTYLCEYQGEHWGAGTCAPLIVDDNVTQIESNFEAWWAVVQESDSSIKYKIAWGFDNPMSGYEYPGRWIQQLLDSTGSDQISKTCDGSTVYWDSGYYASLQQFFTPVADFGNAYRKVSYSLKNISIASHPTAIPITIGSYSGTEAAHITFPDVIKNAIADKFGYQRVLMDDIGFHYARNAQTLSNSSEWLFINNSYFGYDCDQLMVNQESWESAPCNGTCMDRVLSTWDVTEHGIDTIPFYDYLDLSNGIEEAIRVTTDRLNYSEESIAIDFEYTWDHCNLTIESSDFAFMIPDVCNAVSSVSSDDSMHSTNVSFENCGDIPFDFKYTTYCANGYSVSTSSTTVSVDGERVNWLSAVTTLQCDTVTSISIVTATCPEFWDISCSWLTAMQMITDDPTRSPTELPTTQPTSGPTDMPSEQPTSVSPTRSPTNVPTTDPTIAPTAIPTKSPISAPTAQPSNAPTQTPIPIHVSCTQYQAVPVRGAEGNTISHQEFCLASKRGGYIVDINAQKPYYVAVDSTSTTTTTINKIEESDYDTGRDSTVPATGSALVGNFILYIERWLDVMAYLRMDLSTSSTAQSVLTSIKIDGLNITNVLASISQDAFKSTLKDQIVSELSIESDQVTIISLRSGSIIAEIELSSTGSSTKSAAEIDTDLQNYVAATTASTPSISSPLNTVNGFFYANESNDIMFTDCPYQITKTTLEDETVTVEWDTPTIVSRFGEDSITVSQAIGSESGDSFAAGSYFIRYVAVSTNTSISPKYCSFAVVVEEEEWYIDIMGFEFGMTALMIIVSVMFCLCCGIVLCSCILHSKGKGWCGCKKGTKQGKVAPEVPSSSALGDEEDFGKANILPPAHDVVKYDQDEDEEELIPQNNNFKLDKPRVSQVNESDNEPLVAVEEETEDDQKVMVEDSAMDESAVEDAQEPALGVQVVPDSGVETQDPDTDDQGVAVDTEEE